MWRVLAGGDQAVRKGSQLFREPAPVVHRKTRIAGSIQGIHQVCFGSRVHLPSDSRHRPSGDSDRSHIRPVSSLDPHRRSQATSLPAELVVLGRRLSAPPLDVVPEGLPWSCRFPKEPQRVTLGLFRLRDKLQRLVGNSPQLVPSHHSGFFSSPRTRVSGLDPNRVPKIVFGTGCNRKSGGRLPTQPGRFSG